MYISPTRGEQHVPSNLIRVDEHDEGLIHTSGHLDEANTAALRFGYKDVNDYTNRVRSGNVDKDVESASTHLISTRMPYTHHIDIIPGEPGWRNEHDAFTAKLIAAEHDPHWGYTVEDAKWQAFGDDTQSSNFREAMGELRHRVRGVLRDPSSPRAREIMEHALANPVHQPQLRGWDPERFSPQFLKIIQQSRRGHDVAEDVVDLSTGTWAKIHPDENPSRINDITEHNLIGKKRKEIAEHNKRYEALSKPANDAKLNAEWFYRTNPDVDRMDDEGNVINKPDWKACSTNTRYGSFSHGSNNCACNGGNC